MVTLLRQGEGWPHTQTSVSKLPYRDNDKKLEIAKLKCTRKRRFLIAAQRERERQRRNGEKEGEENK